MGFLYNVICILDQLRMNAVLSGELFRFVPFSTMTDTLFGLFQLEYFVFFVLGTSVYHLCTKGHDYLMSLIIFEVNLVVLNLGMVLTSFFWGDLQGQVFSLCYFTVAAGETALILSCLFVLRPFFSPNQ